MPRSLPFVLACLALVAALLSPTPATAQRGRRQLQSEIDGAREMFATRDPQQMLEGLDLLLLLDDPAVIPAIAELLRSGPPANVADRALDALAALEHRSAMEVLVEFTNHRRPAARRRAYLAISVIPSRDRPALLEGCLSDSDRTIRGLCAESLGDIGSKRSLDILFRAFERGVLEAAISIGKLGDEEHIDRFDEYLGQQPLPIMLKGYDEFLKRRDISRARKIQIVTGACEAELEQRRRDQAMRDRGRTPPPRDPDAPLCDPNRLYGLGEIGGPAIRTFLFDYLNTFPENDDSELVRAVEETIRRIPDDPNMQGVRIPSGGDQ